MVHNCNNVIAFIIINHRHQRRSNISTLLLLILFNTTGSNKANSKAALLKDKTGLLILALQNTKRLSPHNRRKRAVYQK